VYRILSGNFTKLIARAIKAGCRAGTACCRTEFLEIGEEAKNSYQFDHGPVVEIPQM
jgi:hypothetical protein